MSIAERLGTTLYDYVRVLEKAGEPLKALRVLRDHPAALSGSPSLVAMYQDLYEKVRHCYDFKEYCRRYGWDTREPLSDTNLLTLPRYEVCAQHLATTKAKSVCSIGPATGEAENKMLADGVTRLHMVDVHPSVEKLAETLKLRHPTATITWSLATDYYVFNVPQEQFDVVWCLEVLEHVPSPSSFLRAVIPLARHLILSTPDALYWFEPDLPQKSDKWYHHVSAQSLDSIEVLLENVGFEPKELGTTLDGSIIVLASKP